jgi:DNA-binding PadR family transcriptional regulator
MHDYEFRHSRRRGRRHGWDFGPYMWQPFSGGPGFRRGPRVRRGDVRAAALALLAEQPYNGYQIIGEIMERSAGVWRPSPGSVYPALAQLETDGLIVTEGRGGRRVYRLTEAGQAYVEAHPDEVDSPWDSVADTVTDDMMASRELMGAVAMAFMQVAHAGSDEQVSQARQVLSETRRSLYRILADEPADRTGTDEPGTGQNGPDDTGTNREEAAGE